MFRPIELLLAIIVFLFFSNVLNAQDTQRITAAPLANGFYGEYEIIDQHPNCSAPDEIAFRVKANLRDVMFRAEDVEDGEILEFGLTNETAEPICYLKERRGVESVQLQVRCTPARLEARLTAIERISAQLDLAVDMTSCLSPLGYENLGGTWSATLRQPNSETVMHGTLSAGPEVNTGTDGVVSRLTHNTSRNPWSFWAQQSRTDPIARALNNTAAISIEFACIPVALEGDNNKLHHLSSKAWLFLTKDTPPTCTGTDCPVLNDGFRYSPLLRTCRATS